MCSGSTSLLILWFCWEPIFDCLDENTFVMITKTLQHINACFRIDWGALTNPT